VTTSASLFGAAAANDEPNPVYTMLASQDTVEVGMTNHEMCWDALIHINLYAGNSSDCVSYVS